MTVKEKVNQFLQARLQRLRSTFNTPVNLTQGQRNAMDVASGLATGVAKGVPGEQFLLNKMRVSVPKPTTLGGKISQFVGENAPMVALTAGIGSALKGVKGVQLAQKPLLQASKRLIAKGGATKLLGQGIAGMTKGIPTTLGYEAYRNISQRQSLGQSGKSIAGNLAFDLATGPIIGIGGMVVGKNALNYVNLPKITKTLDNLPKAEISDLSASLAKNWDTIISKLKNQGETPVLADVLKHETLFKNYPSLRTMKIDIDPSFKGVNGSFDANTNSIKVASNLTREKFRSTLLHEVQHAIQQIEGFAKGGTPKDLVQIPKSTLETELKPMITRFEELNKRDPVYLTGPELVEKITLKSQIQNMIAKGGDKFQNYKSLAGEIEARSTQLREGMTAAQRKAINPYDQILNKEGIKRSDVVVNMGGGEANSKIDPLIQEAKKYKSAEEFVNKILPRDNVVYDGLIGYEKQNGKWIQKVTGTEVVNADKISQLDSLWNKGKKPFEHIGDVFRDGELWDSGNLSEPQYRILNNLENMGVLEKVKGTAGIHDTANGVADIWKPKSQLTDIWNKANSYDISQSAKVPKEVVGESNQLKSAKELTEKITKSNQTYQPYSVPSKPIIPRNLLNEIQTNAKSIEPSVETMQKISKKVDIDVGKEKAYKLKQAEKLITNSIKENTSGAIEKDVKLASNNILNSSEWKDKSKLFLGRETMSRNFDDVMGKDASNMKKIFLDPVGKSEADRIRFVNKERTDIKALGIKPNSKESSLLQMYGEGKTTLENLKKQTPDWQKIVDAEKVFRQKYDTYLSKINQALVKNGYDPIPKRKDYFLHFNDVGNILENFGIPVKADLLPTDINGLTADFKPGKNFFSSALERKGDMTKFDAISGIDKYLNGASKQIYMTDNIQRLRMLEQALRDKNAGTTHLTNFVADLGEYINNIAGKKSIIDRGAEGLVGRRIYTAVNALKSQVGANAVGANVSSALTNFIPLTQALATTNKVSFLKGMLQTLSGVGKSDGFINKSDFLTRRYGSDPLSIKLWNNIGKKAGWLFSTVDKFTSETIVRGKYLDGLNKGLSESQAMAKADDWAVKVIADRSVGQMPTLFTSKTLGFLTQFQLEVNNQLSFILKDIPRNFNKPAAASAIAQVFLYGYLYNQLYEKLTGRRPALDPIGWAQKAYQDSKNPNIDTQQKIENVGSDIKNQLPFVSTFSGGRVPIANAVPDLTNIYKSATKDGGPDLLGIGKELITPAINVLPTGGSQLKKTIQGISAFNKGYVGEPDSVKFPVEKNLPNLIRMGVFGPYSTPEASAYFRSGVKPLSEKQSAEYLKKLSSEGYIKSEDSPQNILQTAALYGEGFIKDFPGTIYALSKGNPIRKVRGDAVVLERQKNLSKLDSGDTTTQVDHIIAVAVGGTNEPDNLRVLSTADNQAKAKIDAKLANMLESGEITKEEAEKTMLSIKDMYPSTPIIPVDTSKDYYQKVLSDRIANKNKTPASSTASTSTTSEEDNYPYKLNSAKLTNFYNSGDYLSWMRTASEQVTLLSEQYKSATDELEKVQIANKIATLQNKIKKYGSYRGFKAPKKLKKITFKKTAHKKLAKINIKPLGTTRAKSILWAQPKLKAPVGVDLESLRHPKIG